MSDERGTYVVVWHTPHPRLVGVYDTEDEARRAGDKFRRKHHPYLISINREVWNL